VNMTEKLYPSAWMYGMFSLKIALEERLSLQDQSKAEIAIGKNIYG